jgi:Na+/proline symporter
MKTVDIVIIVIYLIGMFGIGVYARTRIKSVDDFLVAGNRFKTFSLVGTLCAALMGAGMTMGIVGSTYQYGAATIWNFVGCTLGCLVFGLIYCGPVRRTKTHSMAELISGRFGRIPRFCTGLIVPIYCLGCVTICVAGMGRLITYIAKDFNMNISLFTAVLIRLFILPRISAPKNGRCRSKTGAGSTANSASCIRTGCRIKQLKKCMPLQLFLSCIDMHHFDVIMLLKAGCRKAAV